MTAVIAVPVVFRVRTRLLLYRVRRTSTTFAPYAVRCCIAVVWYVPHDADIISSAAPSPARRTAAPRRFWSFSRLFATTTLLLSVAHSVHRTRRNVPHARNIVSRPTERPARENAGATYAHARKIKKTHTHAHTSTRRANYSRRQRDNTIRIFGRYIEHTAQRAQKRYFYYYFIFFFNRPLYSVRARVPYT